MATIRWYNEYYDTFDFRQDACGHGVAFLYYSNERPQTSSQSLIFKSIFNGNAVVVIPRGVTAGYGNHIVSAKLPCSLRETFTIDSENDTEKFYVNMTPIWWANGMEDDFSDWSHGVRHTWDAEWDNEMAFEIQIYSVPELKAVAGEMVGVSGGLPDILKIPPSIMPPPVLEGGWGDSDVDSGGQDELLVSGTLKTKIEYILKASFKTQVQAEIDVSSNYAASQSSTALTYLIPTYRLYCGLSETKFV